MPAFDFWGNPAVGRHRAGVVSVLSNPYMIEGLIACETVAGWGTPSCSARVDWHHLEHSLYREDRFETAFGLGLPFGGLRVAAIPAMDRQEVTGFGAVRSYSVCLGASYEYGGRACIGFARCAYRSDTDRRPRWAASFVCRAGPIGFALDHASHARGENTRLALEARINESFSLVSGYRWQMGELSTGIIVSCSPVAFSFSWTQNPALGSTVSVGVGRLWEW